MSRFATDSDNDDSDDSNATKCFAMNPANFFKRSTYAGAIMRGGAVKPHHLSPAANVFAGSQLSPPHYELKMNRRSHTAGDYDAEPFDPTYGFARFAAANNVYFQATASPPNNGGGHVPPSPPQHLSMTPPTTSAMFQDVLFPLRTSTESKKSDSNCHRIAAADTTNNQEQPYAVNRKRVKFNELISSNSISSTTNVGPSNYRYSNDSNNCRSNGFAFSDPSAKCGQPLSLRQRLANFFSNLF